MGDFVGEGRAEAAALAVSRAGGGRLMLVGRVTGAWLTMLLTPAARRNMPWFV
jgi:hypothetical protein